MNKHRRTQILSYLVAASLLLSFWICVEGCQEAENESAPGVPNIQSVFFDSTEKDSCSIRTSPSVIFSNPESFAAVRFFALAGAVRKVVFLHIQASVLSYRQGRLFVRLPLKILHQLRI